MNADEIHQKAGELITKNKDFYLRMPGIKAVSLGKKTTGGKETGELAIKFHVEKKLAPGDLSQNELIPSMIEGIQTDVVLDYGEPKPFINPSACYRPMCPGLMIRTAANPNAYGTLGCFIKITQPAAIPTVTGAGAYVQASGVTNGDYLLTNEHVLHGANADIRVAQPDCTDPDHHCANFVASMNDEVHDCAIAKLVNANARNIIEITPGTSNTIDGAPGTAVVGDKVYKTGARTGVSAGTVTDVNYARNGKSNQVVIEGWADHGDSGSVWVRASDNKAVCLLWGGIHENGITRVLNFDISTQLQAFAQTGTL